MPRSVPEKDEIARALIFDLTRNCWILQGLNLILESLAQSLPVVGYLAILYFILLFFFGVLGVVLLGIHFQNFMVLA